MTMPDFSKPRVEPLRFTIDGDVFECAGSLPAGGTRVLANLVAVQSSDDEGKAIAGLQALGDFLDVVMLPESAKLFAERMKDPVRPITDEQIGDITDYLMESYGRRPTVPSTPSPDGRLSTGQISTDGVPAPESTLSSYLSTGS